MKKLTSSFKNMVIVLTAVTVLSGLLLGYMNEITMESIAQANAKTLSDAIAVVVPGFDNQPTEAPEMIEKDNITYTVYKATKGGEFIGAAVRSSANGFSGPITILVGFDAKGNIIDYSVLSHAETPGLGSKMDVWFKTDKNKQSIKGLNPGEQALRVSKDGGTIDAITASTITSRAFLAAVNQAYNIYMNGENASSDGTTGATSSASSGHGTDGATAATASAATDSISDGTTGATSSATPDGTTEATSSAATDESSQTN